MIVKYFSAEFHKRTSKDLCICYMKKMGYSFFMVIGLITLYMLLAYVVILPAMKMKKQQGFTFVLSGSNDVKFNPHDQLSYKPYTDRIISPNESKASNSDNIDSENVNIGGSNYNQFCIFKDYWLDGNNKERGYPKSKPCMILTYINDSSYIPQGFDSPKDLPADM